MLPSYVFGMFLTIFYIYLNIYWFNKIYVINIFRKKYVEIKIKMLKEYLITLFLNNFERSNKNLKIYILK